MTAGNIPYRNLVQAQGDDYRVRLDLSAVPKLYAYPFFFSARLYSNYALVTIKEKDKQLNVKVEFLVIQPEQFESLKDEKDRFVSIATKEGKIRLAFLPQNKDYILHALYPDKYKTKTDTLFSVGRNSKVNTRLKSEALLGGKEMRYRILSREQVEQLAESVGEDRFAVFSKNAQGENLNGQYNVVFKEDDTAEIESALQNPKTTKRKL